MAEYGTGGGPRFGGEYGDYNRRNPGRYDPAMEYPPFGDLDAAPDGPESRRGKKAKDGKKKPIRKNILRIGDTKVRLGAFDYYFLLITIILVAFGIIMLYSASSSRAYATQKGDSLYYVKKQLGGLGLGLVLMLVFMSVDYHVLAKFSLPMYLGGLALLVLVLIPGMGRTAGGATRWIFGFQPSEIMKLATILFLAWYLDKYRDRLGSFFSGFLPCLFILGAVALLLLLEPHFSATILIVFTGLLMMFAAGAKLRHFGIMCIPAALGLVFVVITSPYRLARVTSFMNPFADKQGSGWQIVQSLYAIGSGGFWGLGFGRSRQKYMSLPEPHNDFIFSVLAEELGWIGVIVVIVLFILLMWRGIKIARSAPDMLGRLIVVGCVGLIGVQALVNIGVVSATLPVTGMPLPFFSYGGTALAITMAEIGLVLNVSRQERVQ